MCHASNTSWLSLESVKVIFPRFVSLVSSGFIFVFRFVYIFSFRFISFCFFPFHIFRSFRFISFTFVSFFYFTFHFVSCMVSFLFFSFRLVSFRLSIFFLFAPFSSSDVALLQTAHRATAPAPTPCASHRPPHPRRRHLLYRRQRHRRGHPANVSPRALVTVAARSPRCPFFQGGTVRRRR